jgi:hypothetical protein
MSLIFEMVHRRVKKIDTQELAKTTGLSVETIEHLKQNKKCTMYALGVLCNRGFFEAIDGPIIKEVENYITSLSPKDFIKSFVQISGFVAKVTSP